MFQAARDDLRVSHDRFALPSFAHGVMVSFPAADGNAFCGLARKKPFV
jgi:hypothetical protein